MAALSTGSRSPRRLLARELVGRDAELGRLKALFDAARSSSGTAALITGEAGIGKTALLRVFAAHARRSGARVLVAECSPIGARRPFGPLVRIAEEALERWPAVARQMPTVTRSLGSLLPALAGASERAQTGANSEAFVAFMRTLARDAPLVLGIDDLHWADESTLEVIPLLARRARNVPLLLVLTTRTADSDLGHAAKAVLVELERARSADEIALRPLEPQRVAEMTQGIFGGTPVPATFTEALAARAEGNPFFVEELLRALAERGALREVDGRWAVPPHVDDAVLPRSVRRAVELRLQELPGAAQGTLRVAATLGVTFEDGLVARTAQVPEAEAAGHLRAAERLGLLERAGPTGHRFRHALTREAILSGVEPLERRALHQRAARTIEAWSEGTTDDRVEELAYHFDEAGERDQAMAYHARAAKQADRFGAFARARVHLERAIALAPEDDGILGDLELQRAGALSFGGSPRYEDTLEAADAARRHFERTGDTHRLALALTQMTFTCSLLGRRERVWELGRRAEALAAERGDAITLAAIRGILAREAMMAGDEREALELGESSLRSLDPLVVDGVGPRSEYAVGDVTEIYAHSLNTVGCVRVARGDRSGLEMVRTAAELSRRHGLAAIHRALQNLAALELGCGGPDEAVRAISRELLDIAGGSGGISAYYLATQVAFWEGDWDRARQLLESIPKDIATASPLKVALTLAAVAREGPGRADDMMAALEAATEHPGRSLSAAVNGLVVQVRSIMGDHRGVLAETERAMADIEGINVDDAIELDVALVCALEAARAVGDDAEKARWLQQAASWRRPVEGHAARGRLEHAKAERAAQRGDIPGALTHFASAAEAFSHLGCNLLARTLPRLRRVELLREQRGGRRAAEEELALVVAEWRKVRAEWYLERLREWAATHGVAFPGEKPWQVVGESAALTRREREVADLVAGGLTNKEIASEMHYSVGTVKNVVQRVIEKLGVSDRTQAAVCAVRAGLNPPP